MSRKKKGGSKTVASGTFSGGVTHWRIVSSYDRYYFVDMKSPSTEGRWITLLGEAGMTMALKSTKDAKSLISQIEAGDILVHPDGRIEKAG